MLPVFHALPYHKDSENLENFVCEELGLRLLKVFLLVLSSVSHRSGVREAVMQAVQPHAQLLPTCWWEAVLPVGIGQQQVAQLS